jgi:hypothetical protein
MKTVIQNATRSEKGGIDPKVHQPNTTEYTRTLYDYPRDQQSLRIEVYRRAHPAEVSAPTEFISYLRDEKPELRKRKRMRFMLPTEESTETLHALHITTKMEEIRTKGSEKPEKRPLTEADIPRLRQQWYEEFKNILQGTPEELPPLREVNHEINLIDPDKKYTHRLPTCPVPLQSQFYEKLNCYVDVGWWKEHPAPQAAPLMCLPKKDGRL